MSKETLRQILLISALLLTSCESDDSRVAQVATAAAERQAQQSTEMAKAHAHLTQGAKDLVESAGRSQEALVTIQRDLEKQHAEIGHQRDSLERERQAIAAQRQRDPVIANAILQTGLLAACLLPLVVCWFVLRRTGAEESDPLITEILIEDLTSSEPKLLPGPTEMASEPRGHLPQD